jgi:hypothetical protein
MASVRKTPSIEMLRSVKCGDFPRCNITSFIA